MNKDIFFKIIKYLPMKERPKLSFLNKEYNKLWTIYSKKYYFIVTDSEIDVGHVKVAGYKHTMLINTNNYLEALSIYNKRCKYYSDISHNEDNPYVHQKLFIHNTTFTGVSEMYEHYMVITLFPSDLN